jgi:arsenite methyltransferase
MSELREGVLHAYSAVGDAPDGDHPFPVGRAFALSLGYPEAELDRLPAAAVDAFTGVSNVAIFADIESGDRILDVGCGGGLDSLIAARRTGPRGRVHGVDFSPTMVARARRAADEAGQGNVAFQQAPAEELPLPDDDVDVVLVNGIFNLNPARAAILAELRRVLRPGGSLFVAELIRVEPGAPKAPTCSTEWFT